MSKVAVITGASSGIGAAAAITLADRGVNSILTFNSNMEGAHEVAAEVRRRGAKAIPLRLDVGAIDSFAAFRLDVASILDWEWSTGTIDFLVNNAGFGGMARFEDTTEETFDRFLLALLKGPYFLTQALLPIIADGGAIVNVSSTAGIAASVEEGYSAYGTMKGGLAILTRYMAKEFSRRGIRVNAVAPGPTRTRIGGDVFDKYPEFIPPLVEKTALGRLGDPADVGSVIASLLSDECRWVTGQEVEVSGGYRL
ncbi:SDR family NAD(P)-dependent oxidoreductase [Arenibaculum pallidiluteum]|uniref:SDR family NAD(P)-dependent oxidoreductase n=1 Tax=Arenibaculum pallidiluteum TaxID=2812559 RepID=UPI001A962FB2|nr:SDR family oxidoreductase [Arenibaculum pallidiluteum]